MAFSQSQQADRTLDLSFGIEAEALAAFTDELLDSVLEDGCVIDKDVTDTNGNRRSVDLRPGWAVDPSGGKRELFIAYTHEPTSIAIKLIHSYVNGDEPQVELDGGDVQMSAGDVEDAAQGEDEGTESEGSEMDMSEGSDESANRRQKQPIAALPTPAGSSMGSDSQVEAAIEINEDKVPKATALPAFGVINDFSIPRFTKEGKAAFDLAHEKWDTGPVEFVSKVYSATDIGVNEAMTDVQMLSSAMNTVQSRLLTTPQTGLHIHIGRPDNSRLPLKALRVLVFITLVYEREISKLHATSRINQVHPHSQIFPNLRCWEGKYFPGMRRDCKAVYAQYMRSKYLGIAQMRNIIFKTDHENENAAYAHLKSLFRKGRVDIRRHVINWENIDGLNHKYSYAKGNSSEPKIDAVYQRPPTVEFRQHEGTFDATTIGHMVHSYVALVRYSIKWMSLGELMMANITSWSDRIVFEDLLAGLELPEGTRTWLEEKVTVHNEAKELLDAFAVEGELEEDDFWENEDS